MKQIDTFYATYKFHEIDVRFLFFRIHSLVAVIAEMGTHVPKDLPQGISAFEVRHAVFMGEKVASPLDEPKESQVRAAVRELIGKVADDFRLPELGMTLAVLPQYNAVFEQA